MALPLPGQEQPVDTDVRIADNSVHLDTVTTPVRAVSPSHSVLVHGTPARAFQGEALMRRSIVLAALMGLFGLPTAHGQSIATVIGLRQAHLRYVADPKGDVGWLNKNQRHCRQFGLGGVGSLGPTFHPHFVLETDPMSSANHQLSAIDSADTPKGFRDADLSLFSIPLPWCKSGALKAQVVTNDGFRGLVTVPYGRCMPLA